MAAAWKGFTPICKELIDYGADVNLFHNERITPLIFAGGMGHTEIVQMILRRSADVNHA